MNSADTIYVDDELFIISSREDFTELVEQKLGREARELMDVLFFNPYDPPPCDDPDHPSCPGECVHTYRMQEHYERGIRDAVEDLDNYLMCKPKRPYAVEAIIKKLKEL